ncbi:MAG: TolC family protein [Bryobacteraceae bacterium]|jgi:cobalt-zinc-cadmium efflux system outer membrane protein
MHRLAPHFALGLVLASCLTQQALAQKVFTWQQVRDQFEAANPTLRAGETGIAESRAAEISANLRPNPDITTTIDQFDPFTPNPYRPLTYLLPYVSFSYLHEREHKRELRLESARKATNIAESSQADLERNLLFNLRGAFVQTLQSKALLKLAQDNLAYWDKVLSVSRDRYRAGDIAQIDLDRLELQRVQFQSDLLTAEVNLRTAKIQILTLLNDRTPVEQFDVDGPYDFASDIAPLEEFRRIAQETRPDLKAAVQSVDKAKTDHTLAIANGSADPTFAVDIARNPPIPFYVGFSMTVPLRIFDRNQGEKLRTQLDIARNEKLRDATLAQVFSDVDSAYAMLNANLALLGPYKADYLPRAVRVRDTVAFAYQRGGASLLDFLNAQSDYRGIELNYLNLVGSYLTAASQLSLAVGREVVQ